jgi:hypothetical protein
VLQRAVDDLAQGAPVLARHQKRHLQHHHRLQLFLRIDPEKSSSRSRPEVIAY